MSINNYRNCIAVELEPHARLNVLTGLNGAGKTSILDAIYYLTNGRSFFSSQDVYLYFSGEDYFRLTGRIFKAGHRFTINLSSSVERKKQIKVDDKQAASISEYYGKFPAFMIAPRDIRILVDSSSERRKLIDRTLSAIDSRYLRYLLDYNRLLKQRNAMLKDNLRTGRIDKMLIRTIDEKMDAPANYIFERRKEYLDDITPIFREFYDVISEQNEELDLHYRTALSERNFLEQRSDSFRADTMAGKTTTGIHKDDLVLFINNNDIRKYASQGQLKSAIISLKLAQISLTRNRKNIIPILLLDDIFDKLDVQRVEKLLDLAMNNIEAQIFISDTEIDKLKPIIEKYDSGYKHFFINKGNIQV